MKVYANKASGMTIISGKITAIDGNKVSIATQEYKRDAATNTGSYENITIDGVAVKGINEDAKVGDSVTAVGQQQMNFETGENEWKFIKVSTKNASLTLPKIAVIAGDVVYARYNEEKDANGNPNMTKERTGPDGKIIPAKAKSPHFDIGVSTMEPDENGGERRVLHTIKVYPDPVKDKDGNVIEGKKNFDKIDSLKKRFANFNKETNPIRVTVVSQPGTYSTSQREYNGQTYDNTYCNHMGVYSIDLDYLKTREQAKETPAPAKEETPAPAPEQENPVVENVAGPIAEDVEGIDDMFSV